MKNPDTRNIAVPITTHSKVKVCAAIDGITLSEFTDNALLKDLLRRKQPAAKNPGRKV